MKQEKINELIIYLTDQLKNGVEFAKDQAPEVVKELLAFGVWDNAISIVAWLLVMVSLIALSVFLITLAKRNKYQEEFVAAGVVVSAISVVITLVTLIGVVVPKTKNLLKIKHAPRVYLIDKLRNEK